LLAAATNTVKNSDGTSTLLKYNEPPEARKPLVGWRLYVFKGDEQVGASLPLLSPCLSIIRPHLLITRSFDVLLGFHLRSTPYPSSKCVPHRSRPLGNRHTPRTPVVLQATCCNPVYIASFSPASMRAHCGANRSACSAEGRIRQFKRRYKASRPSFAICLRTNVV
jgi:hypothetical protein